MSESVHATAVLVGASGVLIRGASGTGKSMLAAVLVARGGFLIADDRVHLSACHGRLVATASVHMAGRLELRGRGIVSLPFEPRAVIRLVVDLVDAAQLERLPEDSHLSDMILGLSLPLQRVPAGSGAAVTLVEAALRALNPGRNSGLRTALV